MSSRQAVLIVEDDEQLRHMYRFALVVAGFVVREAADGIGALRTLDRESVDLVVLDLGLPQFSGYVVLRNSTRSRTRATFLFSS